MIKKILALLITAICASCTQPDIDKAPNIAESNIVLDVRSAEEFQTGHLENAINIPHTEISEKISQYEKNKDAKIIVYCRSGRRSGIAKKALEDMGYTDVTNAGGYEDLKK